METEAFAALLTPAGQEVLAQAMAADTSEGGLLASASRLRGTHPAELVGAALTQVRLRVRAAAKFGPDAARMYFTPRGLEQSTRSAVAAYRASRFTGPVLELCCGIGADLLHRARAGVAGTGVDLDPLTVAVARANLAAFDVDGIAGVRLGDALDQDPSGFAEVFADPGRRTARGRVFDPKSYEPPLDDLLTLAMKAPGACVKVAPGIAYEAIPEGASTEWISEDGDVKEAALWLGTLAVGPVRKATLLRGGEVNSLEPDPRTTVPSVRPWGRYLYEPDGAVIRAHLVGEAAALVDGGLADPRIAYITSDALVRTPYTAAYEIHEVLPFSVKRLKAALRAHDVGVLTLKKRGFAADLDRLRRDLRPSGSRAGTVVLTRIGDAPVALVCAPV
ncbi:class I SAM-dependent methyltransferase [Actinocorallia sp. A-T 12471]|uniref:class I SAM-dependent methyltransferase n=1 Tax=Actinocorallia sp. A-T 12471 TaxID=3089813 RepID=UPI0029D0C5A3|nr:class I SAM-dependent methyltransferase [Actinocorallia sp. A-T 12471]MDX6744422.1 class I SAM-dependent methyltransferase [Actinocorallia sp. A-T 12471]